MNRISKVVPAILAQDIKTLETLVRQSEQFASYVQFDFMDGKFVPSISISCEMLNGLSMKFCWEAHLMVENPESCFKVLSEAGAQRVVFHFEATTSPREVISQARDLALGVGIAINPETPVSAIVSLIPEVDHVLLLSVNPGYYGSKYIPEVLDKVAELRSIDPDIDIGIDGGVKESNITHIASVGIDVICVGSAIFLQSDPAKSYRHLLSLVEEGSQLLG
jgi:ribulose-phosphate 3-epimerase